MKRIFLPLIVGFALTLGGCQWMAQTFGGTPSASTQTAIVNGVLAACDVYYKGALKAAFVADDAGLLTPAIKADIHSTRAGVESICPPKGVMPTNATAALVTIVQGSARIYNDLGTKPVGVTP
jgi:hypothetical protein